MQLHNFNSGPAILPTQVLEQAAAAIHNFNNTGLSILEIGHRTSFFVEVVEEAKATVKRLMDLGDEYEVLFLQGGATMQFMQVPMNLLDENGMAAICDNGVWGNKAVKEAKIFGPVTVVADTSDKKHTYLNKQLVLPEGTSYLHITTNNTVEGTQWHQYPQVNVPLVGDMSSDIFCRPTNFKKFDLIYAGAQKNMGAAGVTLVVIKKSLLGKVKRQIPAILDYQKHIDAGSLLNTPPVFSIYVSLLTLRWIEKEGGLIEMEKRNKAKSELLYNTIDALPSFYCPIAKEDRSIMNAVFFLTDPAREEAFLALCKSNGMIGVKGYRTVGGIRVSMYNALPISSVEAFCELMKNF
ncbi:MAG: 3-phosphoserine/phosphohydroxythreonine transaminase [Bacteroidota bacterium]|jgi:phosphoserine aminotransferase